MSDVALNRHETLKRNLWQWLRLLGLSFLVHWPFYVLAGAYALTTYLLLMGTQHYKQAPIDGLVVGIITLTIPAGMLAVFLFRLVQYATVIKPESPTRQFIFDVMTLVRKPTPIITALPLMLAMVVFNKGMLELKPLMQQIKPFSFDKTLMQLDRSLHFGYDPWVLLQPILGYDVVTFLLSVAYNFWFLALFGTFMWFGFARKADVVRTQFFLSYMLVWWIGGGLLALYFSSAGPVYYGAIGLSPDPFAPLMAYLRDVDTRMPILSLLTQSFLWDGYVGKTEAIGIAAFPSMHNASAVLFALAAWRVSRMAGYFFAAYSVVILVGSVHLGWHYAVDGYAAIALAGMCWWLAGFVARWHGRLALTRRLNDALAAV